MIWAKIRIGLEGKKAFERYLAVTINSFIVELVIWVIWAKGKTSGFLHLVSHYMVELRSETKKKERKGMGRERRRREGKGRAGKGREGKRK